MTDEIDYLGEGEVIELWGDAEVDIQRLVAGVWMIALLFLAMWVVVEAVTARQERRNRFLKEYADLDHLHPRPSPWSVPRPPKKKHEGRSP
jgi:hypothetical protein